jgi:predicted methyltransferase
MITNQILCCDYKELLVQIPNESVDVVISDPPFWY